MRATQTFDDILGDQFDIRDVIARFEDLEDTDPRDDDEQAEFRAIQSFLDDVKGYGGDEQWRGDWYPLGFIADSYFERYAEQFAEDIGAINRCATWPNTCIDWAQAARELKMDYSSVTINGSDYWYR